MDILAFQDLPPAQERKLLIFALPSFFIYENGYDHIFYRSLLSFFFFS